MIAPIQMTHKERGNGPPLLLLHGLYGSSGNLGAVSRQLAANGFRAISADLRNHGRSPWAEPMTLDAMAVDTERLIVDVAGGRADVIGHSLGGKVAMILALRSPQRVRRLAALDIAPVRYCHDQLGTLRAMRDIDPRSISSRAEADARMAHRVPTPPTRGFLLQNLVRDAAGGWRWRLNLAAIERHLDDLLGFPEDLSDRVHAGPALAVSGANSDYVDKAGWEAFRRRFPNAEHVRLEGVGHVPHAERPDALMAALVEFLRSTEPETPA